MGASRLRGALAVTAVFAALATAALACNSLIGLNDFAVVDDAGIDVRVEADADAGAGDAGIDSPPVAPPGSLPAVWADTPMPDTALEAKQNPKYTKTANATTHDDVTGRTW